MFRCAGHKHCFCQIFIYNTPFNPTVRGPPLGGSQNLCSLVLRGKLSKASQTRRSGLCCWGSAHLLALKEIAEEQSLIELPLETNKQTNNSPWSLKLR